MRRSWVRFPQAAQRDVPRHCERLNPGFGVFTGFLTLLWFLSRHECVELAEELPGDVMLESSADLTAAFALTGSALDVRGLGRR